MDKGKPDEEVEEIFKNIRQAGSGQKMFAVRRLWNSLDKCPDANMVLSHHVFHFLFKSGYDVTEEQVQNIILEVFGVQADEGITHDLFFGKVMEFIEKLDNQPKSRMRLGSDKFGFISKAGTLPGTVKGITSEFEGESTKKTGIDSLRRGKSFNMDRSPLNAARRARIEKSNITRFRKLNLEDADEEVEKVDSNMNIVVLNNDDNSVQKEDVEVNQPDQIVTIDDNDDNTKSEIPQIWVNDELSIDTDDSTSRTEDSYSEDEQRLHDEPVKVSTESSNTITNDVLLSVNKNSEQIVSVCSTLEQHSEELNLISKKTSSIKKEIQLLRDKLNGKMDESQEYNSIDFEEIQLIKDDINKISEMINGNKTMRDEDLNSFMMSMNEQFANVEKEISKINELFEQKSVEFNTTSNRIIQSLNDHTDNRNNETQIVNNQISINRDNIKNNNVNVKKKMKEVDEQLLQLKEDFSGIETFLMDTVNRIKENIETTSSAIEGVRIYVNENLENANMKISRNNGYFTEEIERVSTDSYNNYEKNNQSIMELDQKIMYINESIGKINDSFSDLSADSIGVTRNMNNALKTVDDLNGKYDNCYNRIEKLSDTVDSIQDISIKSLVQSTDEIVAKFIEVEHELKVNTRENKEKSDSIFNMDGKIDKIANLVDRISIDMNNNTKNISNMNANIATISQENLSEQGKLIALYEKVDNALSNDILLDQIREDIQDLKLFAKDYNQEKASLDEINKTTLAKISDLDGNVEQAITTVYEKIDKEIISVVANNRSYTELLKTSEVDVQNMGRSLNELELNVRSNAEKLMEVISASNDKTETVISSDILAELESCNVSIINNSDNLLDISTKFELMNDEIFHIKNILLQSGTMEDQMIADTNAHIESLKDKYNESIHNLELKYESLLTKVLSVEEVVGYIEKAESKYLAIGTRLHDLEQALENINNDISTRFQELTIMQETSIMQFISGAVTASVPMAAILSSCILLSDDASTSTKMQVICAATIVSSVWVGIIKLLE
eukprot:TRINITY_DN6610_c1_g2_i1.p1 TRINITY_DN6610_c1_g2~~TRINITY_DN6610_c1_g2_i1.p1  ORF type:complete len:1018 (+),score=262.17 TRINITY_DN6610_c1_g2_i1:1-3054(+)